MRTLFGSAPALAVVTFLLLTPLPRGLHGAGVVALVAWPLADAGPYRLAAFEAYRGFPTLADFATERQLLRWHPTQADLERRPDADSPVGASARLRLLPGPEKYPGAALE